MTCDLHASGAIDLYFYDELGPAERASVEHHLRGCAECRGAVEELSLIRAALATRPVIDAPPGGWARFMARLDAAVAPRWQAAHAPAIRAERVRWYAAPLAMAALVVLVTASVWFVARERAVAPADGTGTAVATPAAAPDSYVTRAALTSVTEEHFERSKLVVLGLATKDPRHTTPADWTYERELASDLLSDTRMYRLAAEERGLDALAAVMRDLELVLLQASLASDPDPQALAQIQRLIRKRDLLQKINVVTSTGI